MLFCKAKFMIVQSVPTADRLVVHINGYTNLQLARTIIWFFKWCKTVYNPNYCLSHFQTSSIENGLSNDLQVLCK